MGYFTNVVKHARGTISGDTGCLINPGPINMCNICNNNTDDFICNLCTNNMFPFSSLNDTNFADEVIDDQYYCNNNEINSLINPSQMPDNAYECFRRRGLHFIHVNARSLFYKMSEIRKLVQKSNPAILSVTETWFDTSVTDNSIEIEKYNIIRRGRQSRWGGVCMYIRSDLAYN